MDWLFNGHGWTACSLTASGIFFIVMVIFESCFLLIFTINDQRGMDVLFFAQWQASAGYVGRDRSKKFMSEIFGRICVMRSWYQRIETHVMQIQTAWPNVNDWLLLDFHSWVIHVVAVLGSRAAYWAAIWWVKFVGGEVHEGKQNTTQTATCSVKEICRLVWSRRQATSPFKGSALWTTNWQMVKASYKPCDCSLKCWFVWSSLVWKPTQLKPFRWFVWSSL